MNRRTICYLILLVLILVLLICGVALAQAGNGYDLTWWTVDGGGGSLSGGGYALDIAVGQPDGGGGLLSGEGYLLEGGFWVDPSKGYLVYLPLVIR